MPGMGAKGFSMVELVLVLVIVGVLAVMVIPRLQQDAFDAGAHAEQLATDVRYTQSLAMTRAAPHRIVITAAGWQIEDADGNPVPAADGRAGGSFGAAGVAGFTGTIEFGNVFGHPDLGGDATVTVSSGGASAAVVIRAETGYVEVL